MSLVDSSTYKRSPAKELTRANVNAKAVFATTFGIVIALLLVSPNFQSREMVRQTPYASDFLQEWTGGFIWASQERASLYQPEHFKSVQHDSSIVGFEWPASQYYPMVYPPFYYMLVSPLANLPYKTAALFWMAMLATLAGSTIWVLAKYHPVANQHWGKCLLALVAFYPFLQSLNTAHKSALLLLILTGSYLLLYHQKRFWAGLVFGMIAFKPHLGLLIGFAMLAKGQWRFVTGCLASVASLVVLSLLAGTDLCVDYFWQCLAMGDYASSGGYLLSQSHSFSGAVALLFGAGTAAASVAWWVCAIITLGLLTVILKPSTPTDSPQFALQFSSLIIATILLSPHFYLYDLTIILLPIGLFTFNLRSASASIRKPLAYLCVAIFVGTGLAANIAELTRIQPTIILMLGIMICILSELKRSLGENSLNFATPAR